MTHRGRKKKEREDAERTQRTDSLQEEKQRGKLRSTRRNEGKNQAQLEGMRGKREKGINEALFYDP